MMRTPIAANPGAVHRLVFGLIVIAALAAAARLADQPLPALFKLTEAQVPRVATQPLLQTSFASHALNTHTHAASLVELGDGRIRAFWFAGSREGAPDVEIRTALFDSKSNRWGPEQTVIDREATERSLIRYVKKLGNPVAHRATDGTLWLFYVTVSLGGWAGSSITAMTSVDDGKSWSSARRLVTSPFLNISTLVKGTPFDYSDGTIGLPVYHEFIGKFGELLRIGKDGTVLDKTRLSPANGTLQPVVLIETPSQAMVLMRDAGVNPRRVIATKTNDSGRHWSAVVKTALPNPDAALSGTVLADGRFLIALNDTEEGRDVLSLVVSSDGGTTWVPVYRLEDRRGENPDPARYVQISSELAKSSDADIGNPEPYALAAQQHKCKATGCAFEFSYPYLIQTRRGEFHLVYTWNRSFIKHVVFNRAWLDDQIERSTRARLD